MSMQYRVLTEQAMADSALSADDILALRQELWADGSVDATEADDIFAQNDQLGGSSDEWTDFFVEAICTFLLSHSLPKGYISPTQADWLIGKIDRANGVETMGELQLLERLFERAVSVPEVLKTYAITQIEAAVITGHGPTRDGGMLDPGAITDSECRLLRNFIFAAGGDRPGGVSRAEAELLFRIKDATLGCANAASWKLLFVQGVGNYLQGFGGQVQLSAERAAELEGFMNHTAVNIRGFFARMADSQVPDKIRDHFGSETDASAYDEEAAAAHEVTDNERQWLQANLDASQGLDELEQALLDFIAED